MKARWLLSALLIVAAALFAIGAAAERDTHSEHNETAEHSESTETSEEVLGINLESTPLVLIGVGISVALAAAAWLTNRKVILLVATLFAVAFAALDIAEFAHQIDQSASGLAALAAIVALLHLAAAFVADQRRRHATS